jgi:hypothetical protein
VAAVEVTVRVSVVLVVVALNVTVVLEAEQVGRSTAFEGLDEVSAQARVTVPA